VHAITALRANAGHQNIYPLPNTTHKEWAPWVLGANWLAIETRRRGLKLGLGFEVDKSAIGARDYENGRNTAIHLLQILRGLSLSWG